MLVDDASTWDSLKDPLTKYVNEHFKGVVRQVVNSARKGLIVTRMIGAREAKGDVIVFIDSHIEVTINVILVGTSKSK